MLTGLDTFMNAYRDALVARIGKHPEDYFYGIDRVPELITQFRPLFEAAALASSRSWPVNKGPALDDACRALGIRNTWKAVSAFIRGGAL